MPALAFGVYAPPKVCTGQHVHDALRGDKVVIADFGRSKWPRFQSTGGRLMPVLTGDLIRAVKTESAATVAYHWGVSRWTVYRWRKAVGVGRFTEGTRAAWKHLAALKLTVAGRRKAARATKRYWQNKRKSANSL